MRKTRHNYKRFDRHDTLMARAYQRLTASRLRLARGVALALVGSLCLASPAGQATTLPKITPYKYAYFQIGKLQTNCLFKIARYESNIRYNAVNRSSGAYGAWQIKNKRVAKLNALKQVEWSIRYANHRYGSPCNAWEYWKVNRWW